MLKSKFRLNSKDINKLYKYGLRFRGNLTTLIYSDPKILLVTQKRSPKFAFVVSKKLGNAVERHKYQRRLRHITAQFLKTSSQKLLGAKCMFVAYKTPDKYEDLKIEVLNHLGSLLDKYEGKTR